MTTTTKVYFAAILYALIVGFSFMFTKLSLNVATPLDTLAHRFTIAFIIASALIGLKQVHLNLSKRLYGGFFR